MDSRCSRDSRTKSRISSGSSAKLMAELSSSASKGASTMSRKRPMQLVSSAPSIAVSFNSICESPARNRGSIRKRVDGRKIGGGESFIDVEQNFDAIADLGHAQEIRCLYARAKVRSVLNVGFLQGQNFAYLVHD